MKKWLLLLLCQMLFCHFKTDAAPDSRRYIDSLVRRLGALKDDEDRAWLQVFIASRCFGTDPVLGNKMGNEALAISLKKGKPLLLAASYNAVGMNFEAASAYDSALYYYVKALEVAEKNNFSRKLPDFLGNIANVYYYQGNYPRALEIHKKALRINEEFGNDTGKALTLSNMGIAYSQMSLLPEALQTLFNSLRLSEKLGDSVGVAIANVNIGTVFYRQRDLNKAFDYYSKSLELNLRIGDKRNIAAGYGNVGLVYAARGQFSKALECQQKALMLHNELQDASNIANDFVNLSDVYGKMGKYAEAIECLEKSSALDSALEDPLTIGINKGLIGAIYLNMARHTSADRQNNYLKQATGYLQTGIAAARQKGEFNTLCDFYKALADAEELMGNYRSSAANRAYFIHLNDSVFSQTNKERLENIERERESAMKEKELQIKDLEISKKKRDATIFILLAILLGGTTLWGWKRFRTARSSNVILTEEKKKNIERIEQQNKILMDIAWTQSHTVRGPVSTIMGLVSLYNHDDPADPVNTDLVNGISTTVLKLDDIVKDVVAKVYTLEKTTDVEPGKAATKNG